MKTQVRHSAQLGAGIICKAISVSLLSSQSKGKSIRKFLKVGKLSQKGKLSQISVVTNSWVLWKPTVVKEEIAFSKEWYPDAKIWMAAQRTIPQDLKENRKKRQILDEAALCDDGLTLKLRMVTSLSRKQGSHSVLKDLEFCSNHSSKIFHGL